MTWAENLARVDRSFGVKIKIEAVGHWLSAPDLAATDGDGRTELWSAFPAYVDGSIAIQRDYLTELPSILSEVANALGGFPELGSLNFSALDVGDYLTSLLRVQRPPTTVLNGAIVATDVSLVVDSAASITNQTVIFIGSEALRVTNVVGTTLTVSRGYLGTDAQDHDDDKAVFLSCPFIRNRSVDVYVVPLDGVRGDEQLVGQFSIDSVRWDPMMNIWTFDARSQLRYLERVCPIRQETTRVDSVFEAANVRGFLGWRNSISTTDFYAQWPDGESYYLKIGDEVVAMTNTDGDGGGFFSRRQIAETPRVDIQAGMIARRVLVAEESSTTCSFRYSPPSLNSEDRSSYFDWIRTSHWVDICLCIMTSPIPVSPLVDLFNNGTNLTNYNPTYGNWSCLPFGFGLGLPASKIDWASWLDVKQRTADYKFPNFVLGGEEAMSFADLIEKHFLKPIGAYISVYNGTARIILPRLPIEGEAVIELGADDILMREIGPGQYEPRLQLSQNIAQHTGRIVYEIGPEKYPLTVSSSEFAGTYGQRGYYVGDDRPVTIQVPSGRATDTALWYKSAERRLFRSFRPNYDLAADLDFGRFDLPIGSLVKVKLDELPDLNAGVRGWTAVSAELLEREAIFDAPPSDENEGERIGECAYIRAKLLGYGDGIHVGRVCPSARVSSVSVNDATITQNRYTHSDVLGGLPVTDAKGFAIGDVLKLKAVDGLDLAAGARQTITNIVGNVISLNGNFGGALAADRILVFCNRDNQAAQQYADRVSLADLTALTVGASAQPPWSWGEP